MSDEKVEKHLYRKIEVRMWGDEKFRALSAMLPSAQGLWFYLLTGPHTSAIPGVFRAGRAAMAEELEWSTEGFDEAFAELFQQGMAKADWKAKVVWVPKVINCNPPASPNVVKSWGRAWGLLPECDLKREAYESLSAFVCGMGKPFAEAFEKTIAKPSAKTIGNQEAVSSKQEAVNRKQEEVKGNAASPHSAPEKSAAGKQADEDTSLSLASPPQKSEPVQVDLLGNATEPTTPTVKKPKAAAFEPKSILLMAGVHEQIAADWLALRKKKRADVTPTVIDGAKAEAGKAGMTLNEFLREWCVRGSQGLKAEWLSNGATNQQRGGFMTTQERNRAVSEANMAAFLADEGLTTRGPFDSLPPPNDPFTIDME